MMARSASILVLLAIVSLCAAQDADKKLTFIDPVEVASGVVTGILNKGQVPPPASTPPTPTPSAAPYDANKICDNIAFPPKFPSAPAFNLSKGVFVADNIAFQPKTTYVQQTLDYNSVLPLYNALVAYGASQTPPLPLTGRGEAHITVLTPPEYSVLQPFVTIDQINAIAAPLVQKARFCVLCLGRDTLVVNGTLNTVFNVPVRSPDLVEVRRQIFNAFVNAGGDGSRFSYSNIFAPHITMAFRTTNPSFVAGDLFVENGIYKWDNSCFAPINLV